MVDEIRDQPTPEGYEAAAWLLMCEVAAMRAVAAVESGPEGAFLGNGQPVILFEAHIFDKLTDGRFRGRRIIGMHGEAAVVSRAKWAPGTYGPASVQHARLGYAATLDREAALKSASWGLFQILGTNYERAGYSSIQRFVNAAYRSADDHLRMLVNFIRRDERLVDAIRGKQWPDFARVYNGPGYRTNRYDEKLEKAYKTIVSLKG